MHVRPNALSCAYAYTDAQVHLASYPGSNYVGEGKRAWYLPFAVAKIS